MTHKPTKSPLRYPGGKSRAIAQIYAQLPARIGEFREPFLGGGSVFFAVKSLFGSHIARYWLNDLHPDLIAFWQTVRDDAETLLHHVEKLRQAYPDGRALYALLKSESYPQDALARAVRFFIMNRITFSGVMDAGGYSQQAFESRFTPSSLERVRAVAPLLSGTHITQGGYEPLLEAEGEHVFIFLDPPYHSATESRLYGTRGILHTSFDHERFAEALRACPHRWLVTYDDSPHIRALFRFAHIVEWELQYGMNNYKQGKAAKGRELFIRNY